MSEKKKTVSVLNFFRKNLYYFMIGASLIIIATVIAVVLSTSENNLEGGLKESFPSIESVADSQPESQPESQTPPDSSSEDDKPTDTKIVFILPVSNSTIIKNYTSSTVVFNQTLGVYTGHMGIDFGAELGATVVASYSGKVESITSSYLEGTTVTIDHGNGLKTIYNSIEVSENLQEGQFVSAGQIIGEVSDNNRQEYKDGPHLHFEVTLNGENVNPSDYLMTLEK